MTTTPTSGAGLPGRRRRLRVQTLDHSLGRHPHPDFVFHEVDDRVEVGVIDTSASAAATDPSARRIAVASGQWRASPGGVPAACDQPPTTGTEARHSVANLVSTASVTTDHDSRTGGNVESGGPPGLSDNATACGISLTRVPKRFRHTDP